MEHEVKTKEPIQVLLVDDSAMVRSILRRVLSDQEGIQVVGGAKDPYEARELIIAHRPDVIILDIEMPRMDGLTFLKKLMVHYPVPVIMCSSVAPSNSQAALEAIESGAIDVVAKPSSGGSRALRRLGEDLAEKVRAAAIAIKRKPVLRVQPPQAPTSFRAAGLDPSRYLVAIGASTGGTEAIKDLLTRVPPDFPPVAIVQHMPEGFTKSFADRLNELCPVSVSEAVNGGRLAPGKALLGRGGIQMMVQGHPARWSASCGSDEPVNRHCPSVDVLFDSVVRAAGRRAVGIILTGMGADGAKGLLNLRRAGALTIAQDSRSSVVYGMPKVAVEMGAVQHSVPPAEIPGLILQALQKRSKVPAAAGAGKSGG
jgi:two-component system chemotaxis response regulator CheB